MSNARPLCVCLAAALAVAALPSSAAPAPAPKKPAPKYPLVKKMKVYGSWRLRPESWQWFQPKAAGTFNTSYTFTGSLLRVGVTGPFAGGDYNIEVADSTLLSLPTHASNPAPLGNFGAGGNYAAFANGHHNSAFFKQAYVDFLVPGKTPALFTAGRLEFNDGVETKPADPSVAWLQGARIAQRMIGTFGYTDIQRSFDGAKIVVNTPKWNVTAFGARPTQGVFTLTDDNSDLSRVDVGYLAWTKPQVGKGPLIRVFGIAYDDGRKGAVKTDNRTLAARKADVNIINVSTIGADAIKVLPVSGGKVDLLGWGAIQFGKWGSQLQTGYAYDAEVGYQPAKAAWKPWIRAGYYYASGDSNATDGKHGTFFPVLPTPRVYARFPFYSETNLKDAFLQVILRPSPKLTARADAHSLSLATSKDLWYQGGGAFVPGGNFGYAGTPSGGATSLASLYDISADYKVNPQTTVSLYYGYATPGGVIKSLYKSNAGSLGYVELLRTF